MESLRNFGGPTFKTLELTSKALISESSEVYSHIQIDNEYFKKLIDIYKEKFEILYKIIKKSDFVEFEKFWKENVLYQKSDSKKEESYKKIYDLLEKI